MSRHAALVALQRLRDATARYAVPIWVALILILTAWYVDHQRAQIRQTGDIVRHAQLTWVLVGVVVDATIPVLTALRFQALLRRLGHRVGLWPLVGLHMRRLVVGTITPVGGPASMYVLVRATDAWGVPVDDALLVAGLSSVCAFTASVLLLIPVLPLLYLAGRLSWPILIGSGVLAALVAMLLLGVWLLLREAALPSGLTRRVPRRLRGFAGEARGHGLRSADLGFPFVLAIAQQVANVALLAAALRAVHRGRSLGLAAPLVGYGIGNIFMLISPAFQGLGAVELSMTVALRQMNVPDASALAATLLYRTGDVWLPLVVGLLLIGAQGALARRQPPAAPAIETAAGGDPPRPGAG